MNQAEKDVDWMIALAKNGGDYAQQRNSIIHQLDVNRSTDIPAVTSISEAQASWLLETYKNAWIDWMGSDTDDECAYHYAKYLDTQKRIISLMTEPGGSDAGQPGGGA